MSQPVLLQEGLLGGTLSTAWALSNLDHNHPTSAVEGKRRPDGRQLLDLHYQPKKKQRDGNPHVLRARDYRHVLTVYSISLAADLAPLFPASPTKLG